MSNNFQAWAGEQGRWFEQTSENALRYAGFTVTAHRQVMPECGVEVDIVATNKLGMPLYFSCKGSIQGPRPGLIRTDTLKKAIAEMALLQFEGYGPLIVLASHLPTDGVGAAMLASALLHLQFEVINPVTGGKRLRWLAEPEAARR